MILCHHLDGPFGRPSPGLHQRPKSFSQTDPRLGVWTEDAGKGLGIYNPARAFPFTMSTNWRAISSPQRL